MALSDLIRPRICELGKIKIGGRGETRKAQGGGDYRLPVKYDHFVITGLHRNAQDDLVHDQILMDALKEYADPKDGKLRQLPVQVVSNEIDDMLQASFVWYAGRRVAGRSDGKTCVFFADPNTNQPLKEPVEKDWDPRWAERDDKGNRRFKLHTVFNCLIQSHQSRLGGLYKFRTTSEITAGQLYGSLVHLKSLTGGILRSLPLRLVVRPMQVTPPPDFRATNIFVVHLEVIAQDGLQAIQSMALERLKWEVQNARAIEDTRREYRKLLAIPGHEPPEEAAEIEEEFADEPNGATQPHPEANGKPAGGPPAIAAPPAAAPPTTPPPTTPPTPAPTSAAPEQQPKPADPPAAAAAPPAVERQPGWDDDDDAAEESDAATAAPPPAPLPEARQKEVIAALQDLGSAWHEEKAKTRIAAIIGRDVPANAAVSTLTEVEAEKLLLVLRDAKAQKDQKLAARRKTVSDRREAVP